MFFVFKTSESQKHLLHIAANLQMDILNDKMILQSLEEALREDIELPSGDLHHICNIEDIVVLMWNFDEYTPCSGTSSEDFTRIFKFHNGCPKGIISLPYFILKDKEHVVFRDKNDQIVHDVYTYIS